MFHICISATRNGGGKVFQIDDVTIHPDYIGLAYQDIAVVKLKTSEGKIFLRFKIKDLDFIKFFRGF